MELLTATEQKTITKVMFQPKIMIVDDDPAFRQALSLRLRANNYRTVTASEGFSALALAQKEHPDLILLDLGLPAGDGFTVLKHLHQFPVLSEIPVLVLTARDPEVNERRALASGALIFFQKPVDNEELLDTISMCLRRMRRHGKVDCAN